MACNRERSAADGTSPVPPPPAPATPGSCPNPDVLVERFLIEENAASSACKKKTDLASESVAVPAPRDDASSMDDDKKDGTAGMVAADVMADIADLRMVMKSSGSNSRCQILVSHPSGTCTNTSQEGRVPSPLSLPPPPQEEVDILSVAPPPRVKAVKRCVACRKRVGLLGFKCRCGDVFCGSHRYSDKHDCSYDYKAAGRLAIAKENPVVMASKVNKI